MLIRAVLTAYISSVDIPICGIDSLSAIIKQRYKISLFVPNTLFLFCGHSSTKIKGLLWEGDGFLLLYKRVEEGRFTWPRSSKELRRMSPDQFREVAISAYRRSKTNGKRESDLEGLPARIFEHTLSEEELAVSFPHGYKELPCEVYKRLFIIPETFIVDEHHVHVYASKKNTGEIIKAPRPKDLFRKSIATPALVAAILNAKYSLAIPLDRQSKGFRSNGIDLSTNTMANWVIRSSDEYLSLIYDKLHSALYDCSVIHADETPVKVMRIENQKISNGKRSYMWVYRSSASQDEKPVILYDWQPSRRADHPRDFLKSFSGVVVTDGYQVYHKISHERKDLTIAGCWVHARRPFA